jgi:hypothetical protein
VNGATVVACSKLTNRVDSCVNHSELHALNGAAGGNGTDGAADGFNHAARTVAWLRGLKAALERRNLADLPPTPVFVDNAGVLSMIAGHTVKSANRHIFRTLAEARERVHLDKSIVVVKIGTKDNIANAMTKQEPAVAESAAQLRSIAGPRSGGYGE